MGVSLAELVTHIDSLLECARFQDYCPNGLQVEGRSQLNRIATGVTASQALVDAAIEWGADAIIVHHGYFWRGEPSPVVGIKRRRLAALLQADVSLLAYHLPLDAHPQLGNNARFGQLLGIDPSTVSALSTQSAEQVGNLGVVANSPRAGDVVARVREITGRDCLHIGDPEQQVSRIAWCTGAAQSYIELAVAAGADLYLTGEVSEQTVHVAREEGIQFVAAGHHATERYGVQALGEYLQETYSVEHRFIDIDNPV